MQRQISSGHSYERSLNVGQVYECVNESLCDLRGEAKQSQECNYEVKSSDRKNKTKNKDQKLFKAA